MFSTSIVIYSLNLSNIQKIIISLNNNIFIKKIFLVYNGNSYKDFEKIVNNFKKFENLKCIRINNKGFGNAHNYVIKKFELEKFHIIINPDVILGENTLDSINNFLINQNNVAVVSPKIKNLNKKFYPSVKLLPNPLVHFIRRILPYFQLNKDYELTDYDLNETIIVPSISGCFMVINSQLLKHINGFDETFFLYFEDIDIVRRLSKYGKIYYVPFIEVIHLHQSDSNKSIKFLFIHLISLFKYYSKWGWFFDKERSLANKNFIKNIQKYKKN